MVPMRVLLVESTPGNATAVKRWLSDAGHETTTCFEPPVGLGCKGVDHHENCPLASDTDLALLVRDLDGGARSLTEMGAVCALRHRIPVVEITEPSAATLEVALLAALAEAAGGPTTIGYVQAIRTALASVTSLVRPEDVGIIVDWSAGRVHAMLELPGDVADRNVPMIVDWASRALRAHDPYVKVIDVGVRRIA